MKNNFLCFFRKIFIFSYQSCDIKRTEFKQIIETRHNIEKDICVTTLTSVQEFVYVTYKRHNYPECFALRSVIQTRKQLDNNESPS